MFCVCRMHEKCIHNSKPFQAHLFEVDFNEALFCTLKLKGNETLLVGSFYRIPNSTTENNDNLKELLEKISETNVNVSFYLETLITLKLIGK